MDNYFDQFDAPAAPSGGGGGNYFDQFDPPPSPSSGSGGNFFDQFDTEEERRRREEMSRPQQPAPEAEGMFASGLRSFAHEAPAVVAGAAGALYGAGAGAAAGPVGAIAGGVGGAIAGGFGGAAVADTGLKALGYDDSHQRAVNEKANPWSSAIGQGLAQVLGFGAGTASTAARLAGAGIGGGIETGAQIYQGDFEPSKIAAQTAAGAAFTNPYKWGSRIEQAGQRAGDQIAEGYRARGAERAGILEGDYTVNEPSRKQLEYHGTAGSKSDSFGSEAATPPRKDSDVGDAHQVRGEGSDIEYMKKPDREIPGDQGAGLNTGGRDPDLDLAIKAKSGVDTGEFHGPDELGRYGAKLDQEFPRIPNAEAQGRPLREEPTPPPAAAAPPGGLTPAEMQELMELRAAAAQRAAPPPADAARAPRVDAAPPAAQTPPIKRAPPGRNTDDLSLIDYLASHGGLQDNPEVRAAVQANPFIPGFGQLIRSDGKGMTLDRAWELVARGDKKYLHDEGDFAGRTPDTSWQDVARMINDEVGGKPAFQLGREGTKRSLKDAASAVNDQNLNRIYNDIDNFLTDVGVDPLADRPFRDRMAQIMNKEGITDPEIAHEMVMNEPPPAAKGGQKPGEDVPFDMADEFMRRGVIERGRSGRPIRTAPLPIGSEEGIMKAGLEKVQTTPRPEISGEPTTEAMARKGPPMSREEMQRLIAESGKTATQVPMTSRAIGKGTLTEAQLANQGRSPIETAVAPPATTPKAEAAKAVRPGDQIAANDARIAEIEARLAQEAVARPEGAKPSFIGDQARKRTPEELAQPHLVDRMLDPKEATAYAKMVKQKGPEGDLIREATEAFNAKVKEIKDAGYLPSDFAVKNIPELREANKNLGEIGGTLSRLLKGVGKKTSDPARIAADLTELRRTIDEVKRPFGEVKAERDVSMAKTNEQFAKADELTAARTKRIAELSDVHSRNMESALDAIERAVEAGNKSDVLKAANKAKNILAGVPKEVLADDKPYWSGFKTTITNMQKKDYVTATQEAARGGDKDAQKILDTGVDPTAKPIKEVPQTPLDKKVAAKLAEPVAKPTKGDELKAQQAAKAAPPAGGLTPAEMKELVALRAQAQARQGQPVNGKPAPVAIQGIPINVGAAAQAGGGAPPAGRPPGGPPPGGPPPPGAPPPAAGQPNLGHTPPQQRGFLSELWRDVQRKFGAHMLGPEGMEARRIIRGAYGESQRLAEQTSHMLGEHKKTIQDMPEADRWAMINHMQGGNAFPNFRPTPEQRSFMNTFERAMQEWEGKMKTMDATEQANFRDNYMAQMYENPQVAGQAFAGPGKRGGAGSLKLRKYDTYEDAKAAGLIPKTSDPIEIGTLYANSIKNFVASRQVMERAELTGSVQWFASPKVVGAAGSPTPLIKGGPPPGWKALDTPEKGGRVAYAPEDFADTFNNFYGQGYGTTPGKAGVYETVRNSTNAWTQLELGLNAYHAFTMANEAIISDVAGGLNKMFAGDIKGGLKAVGKAPGSFITRAIEGRRFQEEYLNPNSTNPIAAIIAEANGRPIGRGHAADYTFQQRGSFINNFSSNNIQSELKQAWKEIKTDYATAMQGSAGDKAMAVLRNGGRAIQTVSAPLFDKYIPMLKAGAVHSQMKDWHETMLAKDPAFDMLNNPAHRREAVTAAMKIVDSVDNRFGEMIHDNLFMNATLKQSAQVAMRSFSWAIGSMKEIGGGTVATGKSLYKLAASKGAENRFDPLHPEWDSRMAYAIAFPFVIATTSAIYQMLRAGEPPEGWRDLYAPKTGGMVPGVGGRGLVKEHVLMPGYQKDVLGWTHHPLQEMYNKLGGLPQTLIEQGKGTNWKGDPIVRPNASLPEAASDRMAHIFSKLGPISIKNMVKGAEPTSNITGVETALGFRAPGAFIQDPEGLKRAMEYKDKRIWTAKERRERKIELRQNPGG